ncbi:transcriptional regulator GutM [Oceanobacillus kimchii]|uniref:transcriptional regulator GutM n=1 Tax=Oceanobacillus kimchii TaxID=746691 RepID=UPI003B02E65E
MNLVIIACTILVLNYLLTFVQIKRYRKSTDELINQYKGNSNYYLFSGQTRKMLRSGSIVLIIVDCNYIIKECRVMSGISILSNFKTIEKYVGKHAGEVLSTLHEQYKSKQAKKKQLPANVDALMTAAERALLTISKKNTSTVI